MDAAGAVAGVLLLAVLAVLLGAFLLVIRASLWLLRGGGGPAPRVPPARPRPDDWDDEEYSARHHH